ncbi:class I SAM-dependent methyltransferase [Streptomyces pathocidini]|uniref:class I SAM-dependent methyltransferase n=1 Tax=Streptomyces pathocidini TaxID=1650571 RepID=UPI0033C8E7CD
MNRVPSEAAPKVEPAEAVAATNRHYTLPPPVFAAFLGRRMKYTCGLYGPGVGSLDEAQEAKLRMIASLLGVRGGERVLDIGCGWGALALFLAQEYDCHVTAVAPAPVQTAHLRAAAERLGLADRVEVRDASVEELEPDGTPFDAVAMVGVIEHMPDHAAALRTAARLLRRGGTLYLSASCFRSHATRHEFASRPGSRHVTEGIFGYAVMRPVSVLVAGLEDAGLSMTTLTDLTGHYHRTIEEWLRRAELHRAEIDREHPGLTDDLVRYFRVTNAGWGYTTKHYALTAVRSRMGRTVLA